MSRKSLRVGVLALLLLITATAIVPTASADEKVISLPVGGTADAAWYPVAVANATTADTVWLNVTGVNVTDAKVLLQGDSGVGTEVYNSVTPGLFTVTFFNISAFSTATEPVGVTVEASYYLGGTLQLNETETLVISPPDGTGYIALKFVDETTGVELQSTEENPIVVYVTRVDENGTAIGPTFEFEVPPGQPVDWYMIEVPVDSDGSYYKVNATQFRDPDMTVPLYTGQGAISDLILPGDTWERVIAMTHVRVATQIEVWAVPNVVLADGSDSATIYVQVWDDFGEPFDGETVTLTTDLGTLASTTVVTNESGIATTTITSTLVGLATITATPSTNTSINDSTTVYFILYGNGVVSGEVRVADDDGADNAGAEDAKVWIHPFDVAANNYVTLLVGNDATYIRVIKNTENGTMVVPYDYYIVNPDVVSTHFGPTQLSWCKPVLMGEAGEGYNVTMAGTGLGVVFLELGNYTVQYTNVSKSAEDLVDADFLNATDPTDGDIYVEVAGDLTYEAAEEAEEMVENATAYSNIDYATETAGDGGYTLSGIYGDGSNGVMYMMFAEKDGYRRAFKIVEIEDVEPYLVQVYWPGDDTTDFTLVPRVVAYKYKLEVEAIPSVIPVGGSSAVTATVYRALAVATEEVWEPVSDVTVTLEIVTDNMAANESSWLGGGYTTTVTSGGSATFVAGQAIGTVTINGTAVVEGQTVTDSTTIEIRGFAQLSGYVTNETGIALEGWAQAGKIAVALWTFNETAYSQGLLGPDPDYCELMPAVAMDEDALAIIANYYGVSVDDIKVNETYAATLTPENPRLTAEDAGYAFDNVLTGNEYWIAAYVETENETYFGYAYLNVTMPGTLTANIVVTGVPTITPTTNITESIMDIYDTNNDGEISSLELLTAIDDWREGEITSIQLLELINAWRESLE